MAQSKSSPLIVFRFSLWHLSEASPVMKLMNSDTHSCTVSFASFEIFAFGGRDFFIIRLTFAIGRKRSCSFVELSEMLPEVGLPTGLLLVAVVGFRLWPFMAVEFGRNLKAEGGFSWWWWWKVGLKWGF